MSDIPRFACFSDGMREGYNESWVRSSDYDALRAERDALRARADEHELCAAAVVEIRRLCKEIMGGNLSFVDDDFARCLLTLRDERDALAKDAARYRWLRDMSLHDDGFSDVYIGVDSVRYPSRWALRGEEADEAIDAAMGGRP